MDKGGEAEKRATARAAGLVASDEEVEEEKGVWEADVSLDGQGAKPDPEGQTQLQAQSQGQVRSQSQTQTRPAPAPAPVPVPVPMPADHRRGPSSSGGLVFSNYDDDGDDLPASPVADLPTVPTVVTVDKMWQAPFSTLQEGAFNDSFGQRSVNRSGNFDNVLSRERPASGSASQVIYSDYDDEQPLYSGYAPPGPGQGPGHAQFLDPPSPVANSSSKSEVPDGAALPLPGPSGPLLADPDKLGPSELRKLVRELQGRVAEGKGGHWQGQVEQLQEEVGRYRRVVREQQGQMRALRTAHDSLQRSVRRMRERMVGSTAAAGADHHPDLVASSKLYKRPVSASVRAL